MPYSEMIRRQVLENIYAKLSDEDKKLLAMISMQERQYDEIMSAIRQQSMQTERVASRLEGQNWLTGFSSDVAANFLTDGLIFLARRLLR